METMDSLKKPGIMANLRSRKGFSLVEMAIVLVIIGIIIAAIVKGQDLMLNSRAKQVTAAVTTWRNLAMAYMDRNGRLPGDKDKSGVIADDATELTANVSGNGEIASTMTNAPANPVLIGSYSFYIYFGKVTGRGTTKRNVIVVCKVPACSSPFSNDELEIIKSIDTALDGTADAGTGQFRAATSVTYVAGEGIITDAVFPEGATGANIPSADGVSAVWSTTAQNAAVWSFDRPF